MRKLATIRRIKDIQPIPDADNIEVATVDGWKVVTRKGEFKIGDLAIYCEIDSFIPVEVAPFLTPKNQQPKEFDGIKGNRLRTVKLRGQVSQGLLLPINLVDKPDLSVGDDVTDILGIQKYEPPLPAQLSGEVVGVFPSYVPKTDQERIQNLTNEITDLVSLSYEVTEKLDGSSMTVIYNNGDFHVCSRNYSLKESKNNSFWKVARELQLEEKLSILDRNLALQGELVGEGINKNRYQINGQNFYIFDIYDIDTGCYLSTPNRHKIAKSIFTPHVPVIWDSYKIKEFDNEFDFHYDVQELINDADGKSKLNSKTYREGLVYKSLEDPSISFKVISNKFLLKDK